MSEILKEYEVKPERWAFTRSFTFKILVASCVVIGFGIYLGIVLFGPSSLDVLLGLQADKALLEKRAESLKKENATLQKTYFELKQLDPDFHKE
ncbi:MAG: septum formation initiator [Campylobacteraceae bacterium]|nr:septum formation initiator [Campylobacteraceae bacterium]